MAIDMTQFYQVFFEETAEHLATMESLLLAMDLSAPDDEDLNAIFRAAHSIKGSAGTFGFNDLAEVTHVLEGLLDRIRKHDLPLRSDMVNAFLAAGDTLKAMLAAHQGGAPVAENAVALVCDQLKALTGKGVAAPAAEAAPTLASPAQPATSPTVSDVPEAPALMNAGQKTYEIQFIPTVQATADSRILPNFLQDLGEFGVFEILSQPVDAQLGLWRLRFCTAAPEIDFAELLEFISEKDAWSIKPLYQTEEDAGGAYGLFEPLLDAAAPALFPPSSLIDPVSVGSSEEEDGYGFFEPLPEPAASAGTPALPEPVPVAEEGDGFGFFDPLPTPPEGVIAANKSVSAAVPPNDSASDAASLTKEEKTKAKAPVAETASIRVSVERADQLINLVGELVITQSMLLQCAAQMQSAAPESLLYGLTQLESNTRNLQEAIMSIRMMPISFVFSRFPRVVHDFSAKFGKQVELKMTGEATELDKGLIERIADPLTHLIRNSLDHGIESPDERQAKGKRPMGTITLKAAHQAGNVVIEVGDDGAGLNREKILAKARQQGMNISDQMSDAEVWALIFEAGFSTAEVVTDISGRGVGMDVVRRNVQAMGGRIEIESMTGIGTRMTIRLPLTMAILEGMSIVVGSHTYILPLAAVIETLQPEHGQVKTLANQAQVIAVHGDYLPVVELHRIFSVPDAATDFTRGSMIVIEADGLKAVLFVDALVGQHQVVIKSLEQNYRRVRGISGATIMGDGRVALILDVAALIETGRVAQAALVAVPA